MGQVIPSALNLARMLLTSASSCALDEKTLIMCSWYLKVWVGEAVETRAPTPNCPCSTALATFVHTSSTTSRNTYMRQCPPRALSSPCGNSSREGDFAKIHG